MIGFCGSVMTGVGKETGGSEAATKPSWSRRLPGSARSQRTINPIRDFVQKTPPRTTPPDVEVIRLSNGDPTTYGNLRVPKDVAAYLSRVVENGAGDGYSLSMGALDTRNAVAKWASSSLTTPYTAKDVFLAAGASGAIDSALGSIADEGDNILIPAPGFPLFRTLAGGYGIELRRYELDPDKCWEVKLDTLESLVDDRTRAILLNNPSNPCGSVYSQQHCQAIADLAAKLQLPIICDEIYADMTFQGSIFTPMASVASNVPVLTIGGISKKFVVPGWRLGWILVHDPVGALDEVREGLRRMSTRMLCPATPIQAAVKYILEYEGVSEHLSALMDELEDNAKLTVQSLDKVTGLRCVPPQGSMYVMVEIDTKILDFEDDFDFAEKLIEEEGVEVLPGRCFEAKNFFRVVFAAPEKVLAEAFNRIDSFCTRHIRT